MAEGIILISFLLISASCFLFAWKFKKGEWLHLMSGNNPPVGTLEEQKIQGKKSGNLLYLLGSLFLVFSALYFILNHSLFILIVTTVSVFVSAIIIIVSLKKYLSGP